MSKELTIKQDDFWRLINREQFLLIYFNARLRYRLPATDNECVYIQVNCDDKTIGEHAEQYILSYLEPKHTKSISYLPTNKQILCDDHLLNRLMKEYLVHIEIEDKDYSHKLIFRSSKLTVLYLAIDDFQKTISNEYESDTSTIIAAQSLLKSMSTNFESQLQTVDEQDQFDEQEKASPTIKSQINKNDNSNNDDENLLPYRERQEPPLTIPFPGAEPNTRTATLDELMVKPKKQHTHHHRQHNNNNNNHRQQTSDVNDNELVREMRQKLKGRNLRDIIIDGANIGRTYGDSEFSARGIKLAIDLFQSYGYPDSKIVVILPAHYLSKDNNHVLHDLIRRKIVHKAFQQKIDDQNKRFYDDRLIVDVAVMRNGVILSNDFYRDLLQDSGDAVRKAIRERLLCYRFIGDNLCLPNPVSEGGLPLDVFLSM
ncbi:unnamed protein product [Adineta steineri]|uniref:RNase NYN domain-containing protein n=1 Tax=Adineta steineri TaxID=433720 RepID=A0A818KSD2_9BILA|nr:unnamed protein product [Adineta steineri]CAF3565483.1 unnamed protein product [Adineta steineri]